MTSHCGLKWSGWFAAARQKRARRLNPSAWKFGEFLDCAKWTKKLHIFFGGGWASKLRFTSNGFESFTKNRWWGEHAGSKGRVTALIDFRGNVITRNWDYLLFSGLCSLPWNYMEAQFATVRKLAIIKPSFYRSSQWKFDFLTAVSRWEIN